MPSPREVSIVRRLLDIGYANSQLAPSPAAGVESQQDSITQPRVARVGADYPGKSPKGSVNPNGVASTRGRTAMMQPRWGWKSFATMTQGRRVRANPGLRDAIPSGLNAAWIP